MSTQAIKNVSGTISDVVDPSQVMNMDHGHHDHEAEATDKVVFGFWIYIMSDCILFASIFGAFAVLHNNTFGGP
ncbi:MAG: cyoC, partial [Burkholderiales bacterium]|nr:cyoC [Burkholderiales bacterium]